MFIVQIVERKDMDTSEIVTSLRDDKIAISFGNQEVKIMFIPLWMREIRLMFRIENRSKKEVFNEIHRIVPPQSIKVKNLSDDDCFFQILYESSKRKNYFVGINSTEGFPIKIRKGIITSPIPVTLDSNKRFYMNLKMDYITQAIYRQPTRIYQSRLPEIKDLAEKITKYKTGNYKKILAIHDWVADNLYYDQDALRSGKYKYERYDVLSMLDNRRTICRGYSKLAVTLLRAIDIPAIDVDCFALGESSDGGWNESRNLTAEANHIITFAWANNRWIIMDPTWDSVNEYMNGEYIEKTNGGARHNYFDATLAFFSYTHRFIKPVGGIKKSVL